MHIVVGAILGAIIGVPLGAALMLLLACSAGLCGGSLPQVGIFLALVVGSVLGFFVGAGTGAMIARRLRRRPSRNV